MRKAFYFIFLTFFTSLVLFANKSNYKVDSLWSRYNITKSDSERINLLSEITDRLLYTNLDSGYKVGLKLLKLTKKAGNQKDIAVAYNLIGRSFAWRADYSNALLYFHKSLEILLKIKNKTKLSSVYINIGGVYFDQNDYSKALEYWQKGLKACEENKDTTGIATSYNNLGALYENINEENKALSYHFKSLKIYKKTNDEKGIAYSYTNIAAIYLQQEKYDSALKYKKRALEIFKKVNDKQSVASSIADLGEIYHYLRKDTLAIQYYQKALKLTSIYGNEKAIGSVYLGLGNVYLNEGNLANALKFCTKAYQIAKKITSRALWKESSYALSEIYEQLGQIKKAFKFYKEYTVQKDSVAGQKTLQQITRRSMQFTFDKQREEDSIINVKEKQIQWAKITRQGAIIEAKQYEQYALFGGLILILIFALFIYNRFRITKKQKRIIEIQKQTVEIKNKEISDSITYAKRIQEAILPSRFSLSESLKNGFVLFKPKDIVSGDFYWLERPPAPRGEEPNDVPGYYTADKLLYGLLKDFVKTHRSQPTEAENIFWELVRNKKLKYKFRRQHIIGAYIVDFVCLSHKLIIEIDGLIHQLPENKESDAERTVWLNEQGFQVIRFTNEEIKADTDQVLEKVEKELNQLPPSGGGGAVYFAAADCTGHGVPGAMVSVVCANALSKALLEENITETGKLLDRTREIVIQQFSHSDENVKDGMDISLCKLTPSESGGGLLQWSGANNPLWIIRQNVIASPINQEKQSQSNYEFTEIKGNKQSIGKTENPKPFTTHNIELQKGDSIYIFSDGFADQFGGEDGKKFKYKPLKELLFSMQGKKMDEQKEAISQAFEDWKGKEEQIDDVCVIGVRI